MSFNFNDLEDKTIINNNNNNNKKGRPVGYKLKDEKEKVKIVSFSLQNEVLNVLDKIYKQYKKEDNTITKSKILNKILKDYFKEKGKM